MRAFLSIGNHPSLSIHSFNSRKDEKAKRRNKHWAILFFPIPLFTPLGLPFHSYTLVLTCTYSPACLQLGVQFWIIGSTMYNTNGNVQNDLKSHIVCVPSSPNLLSVDTDRYKDRDFVRSARASQSTRFSREGKNLQIRWTVPTSCSFSHIFFAR